MNNLARTFLSALAALLAGAAFAAPAGKNLGAIWCVGDSITQSNADGDPQGSPRKSLYDLLKAAGYTFTYTGHHTANTDGLPATGKNPAENLYQFHSGISGSVIGEPWNGRAGMTAGIPKFFASGRLASVKPDVVLIMLGTNDTGNDLDLKTAPERLKKFIETLHAQPKVSHPAVFVATLPPNRTKPEKPARVAAFNAALPAVVAALRAEGRDVTLVDMFTPLEAGYATAMRSDNLHPNKEGNALIARAWFSAIEAHAKKTANQ